MVLLLAVIQFRAYSICQTAFGTRLHEDSQRCCPRSSCNGRSNYWGGKLRRDRGIRRPRRKAPTAGDWQGKAPGDVGIFAVGGRSPSRRYLHRSHSGCIVRSPPHVWDPDPNTTHYSVRTGAPYEPEYLKERHYLPPVFGKEPLYDNIFFVSFIKAASDKLGDRETSLLD